MENTEKLKIIKSWCYAFNIQKNGYGNYMGRILFNLIGFGNMVKTPIYDNYDDALDNCYLLAYINTIEEVEVVIGHRLA